MTKYFLIVSLSVLIHACKSQVSVISQQSTELDKVEIPSSICWSEDLVFTLDFFKGTPTDTILTLYGTSAGAVSSISIYILDTQIGDYNIKYEVKSCFYPSESWVKKGQEALLGHEKIHFDIAELFARKMRKSIDSLHNLEVINKSIFNKIIDDQFDKYDKFDRDFDSDTMHGMAEIPQTAIKKEILMELDSLKKYALDSDECSCEELDE